MHQLYALLHVFLGVANSASLKHETIEMNFEIDTALLSALTLYMTLKIDQILTKLRLILHVELALM